MTFLIYLKYDIGGTGKRIRSFLQLCLIAFIFFVVVLYYDNYNLFATSVEWLIVTNGSIFMVRVCENESKSWMSDSWV